MHQACFRFFEERWHQEHANSDMLFQFEILNMRGLKGEQVKAQAAAVEDEYAKDLIWKEALYSDRSFTIGEARREGCFALPSIILQLMPCQL